MRVNASRDLLSDISLFKHRVRAFVQLKLPTVVIAGVPKAGALTMAHLLANMDKVSFNL